MNSCCLCRLIYWGDKSTPAQIERVYYSGKGRNVVARGLRSVTGLALDADRQMLYWSDGELKQVDFLEH